MKLYGKPEKSSWYIPYISLESCHLNTFQLLAKDLDRFDSVDFFTHSALGYVWSALGPDHDRPRTSVPAPIHTGYLGKIILAYQLLDMLLWAADFISHPSLNTFLPTQPPVLPKKLKRILELLKATDLPSVTRQQAAIESIPPHEPTLHQLTAGANVDAATRTFEIAIENVTKSIFHFRQRSAHTVLQHMHGMASILRWFTPVSV
jgi:hypothetical protein